MNRVRSSVVACVVMIGGLGLEAAGARGGDQPSSRDDAARRASAPDTRSRLRKLFDAVMGKETTSSYPKNRDWTTGRDDGFSKPWLRR